MPALTPERLAAEFSRVLAEWLSPEDMEEVRRRNREDPEYDRTQSCASHDFCDANMAMDEAFTRLGVECDVESDEHAALWNAAWDIAKDSEFK